MTRALDLRMVFVGADHEGQEVAKVAPCCFLVDAGPAALPGGAGRARPMSSCSREVFARVT